MTFEEMKHLTDRFNEIMSSSQEQRNNRLKQLANDIKGSFKVEGTEQDEQATALLCTVYESLEA